MRNMRIPFGELFPNNQSFSNSMCIQIIWGSCSTTGSDSVGLVGWGTQELADKSVSNQLPGHVGAAGPRSILWAAKAPILKGKAAGWGCQTEPGVLVWGIVIGWEWLNEVGSFPVVIRGEHVNGFKGWIWPWTSTQYSQDGWCLSRPVGGYSYFPQGASLPASVPELTLSFQHTHPASATNPIHKPCSSCSDLFLPLLLSSGSVRSVAGACLGCLSQAPAQ